MTPLEINKKIAELKKLSPKDWEKRATWDLPFYERTNWAENISDAWELFEEMPFPNLGKDESPNDSQYNCEFASKISGDEYGAVPLEYDNGKAETATLAICKAWLKWKESKKILGEK